MDKVKKKPKIVIGAIADGNDIKVFYKILENENKKFDDYVVAYIDF